MKKQEKMAKLMGTTERGVLLELPNGRTLNYTLNNVERTRLASDVERLTKHYHSEKQYYDNDPEGNREPTPILPYGYVDFTETADGIVTIHLECAHETCPFRWCESFEKYPPGFDYTGIECTC